MALRRLAPGEPVLPLAVAKQQLLMSMAAVQHLAPVPQQSAQETQGGGMPAQLGSMQLSRQSYMAVGRREAWLPSKLTEG